MTRIQTAACVLVTAVNLASLAVVALAVLGSRGQDQRDGRFLRRS